MCKGCKAEIFEKILFRPWGRRGSKIDIGSNNNRIFWNYVHMCYTVSLNVSTDGHKPHLEHANTPWLMPLASTHYRPPSLGHPSIYLKGALHYVCLDVVQVCSILLHILRAFVLGLNEWIVNWNGRNKHLYKSKSGTYLLLRIHAWSTSKQT